MSYLSFKPSKINKKDLHQFIIGAISPRPIALVSTLDSNGRSNLAPYSFFNAFSSDPAILVFSSNLKAGDEPKKDTLKNIEVNKECVINIVNYDMCRQMTLSSIAFEHGVSEFEKSGLTPIESELVGAFRVKESPVQIECTIDNIIALGSKQGAANLVICKIIKMHILKNVLSDTQNRIDPQKLDAMGRLGRSNYVRVKGDNIISMYQSILPNCIGYDGLPESIKLSNFLTGNQIAELASIEKLPTPSELINFKSNNLFIGETTKAFHNKASELIKEGQKYDALFYAMMPEIAPEL